LYIYKVNFNKIVSVQFVRQFKQVYVNHIISAIQKYI